MRVLSAISSVSFKKSTSTGTSKIKIRTDDGSVGISALVQIFSASSSSEKCEKDHHCQQVFGYPAKFFSVNIDRLDISALHGEHIQVIIIAHSRPAARVRRNEKRSDCEIRATQSQPATVEEQQADSREDPYSTPCDFRSTPQDGANVPQ